MKYDPNTPITDEELDTMPDTELFEYLDSRATYLRTHHTIKPLGQHQTKHYAAYSKGEVLTDEELKRAKEIGRLGDAAALDTIRDAMKDYNNKSYE